MEQISNILKNVNFDSSQPEIIKPLGTNISENELKIIFRKIAEKMVIDFKVTPELKPVYSLLWTYFHGQKGTFNLSKGIALNGVYGVGKSTAFRLFHEYLKTVFPFNENMFRIISIEDVINEMNDKNWINGVLTMNELENVRGGKERKPIHILVNEFGYQYGIKNYGTDVNEMIDAWLMKRYDIFQQYRKLTHITTNYGTDELKKMFHPKIIDRFREMFNFIEVNGKSLRK